MGNHGHAGYEEGLRKLLKETNDAYLRSEAILTLAKVAPKAALDTLVELAISEPSADARLSAAHSLELLEPSEAALEKVRAVYSRSDDRSVREALLTALARLGRDALPLLASSLDDLARGETDEHLRSLAASYARSAQQSR
jgi:HEAT repeat protein